jgi:Family of unknown function (DUF6185)
MLAGWAQAPPHNESIIGAGEIPNCPDATTVTEAFTTTVSADRDLELASDLHVTMTGVTPPDPGPDIKLQQLYGPNGFASCFIATDAKVTSLAWAGGQLDAHLTVMALNGHQFTNQLVAASFRPDHSELTVDLCAPQQDWDPGTICQKGLQSMQSTVTVRIRRPVNFAVSQPFPPDFTDSGDVAENTWRFNGIPPRLTVILDVPRQLAASSWVDSTNGRDFKLPFTHDVVSMDVEYLLTSGVSIIWIAALMAAWLLRRGPVTRRGPPPNVILLLVVLAGVLLCFRVDKFGSLPEQMPDGVMVVAAWAIVAAAAGSATFRVSRLLPSIAVLSGGAVACLCYLAAGTHGQPITNAVYIVFCLLLMAVVSVGAWGLWHEISAVFVLTSDDRIGSVWYVTYRRVTSALVVTGFVLALAIPVGERITPAGGRWQAEWLATQLVTRTGDYFFATLGWATALLIISYLSGFIIGLGDKRIGRSVTAGLALMLTMAAPWANGYSIGAVVPIPVFLLQLGVLYIAFRQLSMSGPAPLRRNPSRLLQSIRAAGLVEVKPVDATDGKRGASPALTMTDDDARFRLLLLGPRKRRLGNAKAAAHTASVLAIVPVAYAIRTAAAVVRTQLHTNTGVLLVAIGAVRELVLWIVTGFVFGYLYSKLPGRIGPVKGLAFAAIWIASCLGSYVIAQALGPDVTRVADWTQVTIYRSAQFALFVLVLGVLIDLHTVISAGGTWRDLRTVYDLRNYGEIATAVAPAALLVVTLWQQIAAGSGFEAAKALLSGITSVLT